MSQESSSGLQKGRFIADRLRWLTGGAAVAVALAVAVGVGAAPSPIAPVSEVLGFNGEHGQTVSQAVEDAKASVEEGDKIGPAVSEAACTAAHDRTTLPEGAQNAPGQQDREEKDCTHPSNTEDDGPVVESGVADEESGGKGRGKDRAPGQLKKQD